MFDIGFSELLLVFVIGLIVLGPKRLPVAVKTVVGWIRALRSLATTVQNELTQELKLQEFQDSLKKVEKASLDSLTESMKRSYSMHDPEKASDEANTIHNPVAKDKDVEPSQAAEPQATHAEEPVVAKSAEVPEAEVVKPAEKEKVSAAAVPESSPASSDKS